MHLSALKFVDGGQNFLVLARGKQKRTFSVERLRPKATLAPNNSNGHFRDSRKAASPPLLLPSLAVLGAHTFEIAGERKGETIW